MFEQLVQISKQPIWDGNLICKKDTKQLYEEGYIDRHSSFSFLTKKGIDLCIELKILKV